MALKVRLSRVGKKNHAQYRIVVMEQTWQRDGKYIDLLGFYDPMIEPHLLTLDNDKLTHWVEKGAQLSTGLLKLLKSQKKTK